MFEAEKMSSFFVVVLDVFVVDGDDALDAEFDSAWSISIRRLFNAILGTFADAVDFGVEFSSGNFLLSIK